MSFICFPACLKAKPYTFCAYMAQILKVGFNSAISLFMYHCTSNFRSLVSTISTHLNRTIYMLHIFATGFVENRRNFAAASVTATLALTKVIYRIFQLLSYSFHHGSIPRYHFSTYTFAKIFALFMFMSPLSQIKLETSFHKQRISRAARHVHNVG